VLTSPVAGPIGTASIDDERLRSGTHTGQQEAASRIGQRTLAAKLHGYVGCRGAVHEEHLAR